MPLTEKQIKSIQEVIKRRFIGITYDALGERALTDSELNILKRAGIVESSTRHLVADPRILGKIVATLPLSRAGSLSYEDILRMSKKMLPTTEVEKKAIDYATDHAGVHIRGVMDLTLKGTSAAVASSRGAALRAVQAGVAESIVNRDTISELKTRLFDLIDDSSRDWTRVAHTEMNNAVQEGVYQKIREESEDGEDQLVYKLPNPDACVHCKRVYLMPDGVTPRIFRLGDLEETNFGKRAVNWGPTIGSVHPWCACQLIIIPDGHTFEESESGDVALKYTGKTAKPTKKSLVSELLSETDLCGNREGCL